VATDGTVEAPTPFGLRRGFELVHDFLYAPDRIALEIAPSQAPIEVVDEEGLSQIADNLVKLKELQKTATGSELTRITEEILRGELFLRQNIAPGGDPKKESDARAKSINRVRTAVNSALDYAKALAPLWVAHMRESIDYRAIPIPMYQPAVRPNWTQ
jgi:hypothetical protein